MIRPLQMPIAKAQEATTVYCAFPASWPNVARVTLNRSGPGRAFARCGLRFGAGI
jgi:hypothetical protein